MGRKGALFLKKEGGLLYPVSLVPEGELLLIKVERGSHYLNQGDISAILLSLSHDIGGEVVNAVLSGERVQQPLLYHYVTPRTWVERGGVVGLLGHEGPLIVELGFGNGEFLEGVVDSYRRVVGVEISNWAIKKTLRRLSDRGAYVLLKAPGAWALRWLFSPSSISALFVLFPYPWPKKPSRRMIQSGFIEAAACAIKMEGEVVLATDHSEYASQIETLFRGSSCFLEVPFPLELNTKYLRKWKAQGLDIYCMAYRKVKEPKGCRDPEVLLSCSMDVPGLPVRELWEGFSPWGFPLPWGGYFKVEECFYCQATGALLFLTVLQDPELCLHHYLFLYRGGRMDLLSTWGEVVTPPLAWAMRRVRDRFSGA